MAPRRNPKIEEAPLQGELMLFDPATSKFFVLNRTMAFIWRRCDGAHELPGMVEDMKVEFDGADGAAVEADLLKAMGELVALGLVLDSESATA